MAVTVLALRASGMGDLLTAVPALRALGGYRPPGWAGERARVVVAAPGWLHPVVQLIPGVDQAVDVIGLRPAINLRPSLAVNLHGSGPESHSALLSTRPLEMLAYQSPTVWRTGPQWHEEEPEALRWCRLLAWVGLRADPRRLDILVPPVPPAVRGAIVLHVGATGRPRTWPADRFAEVARRMPAGPIILTGTSPDASAARTVSRGAKLPPGSNLVGRMDLHTLVATIAAARLVVSADTGVAHLASALRVPSVTVFGPASPRRWGPPPLDRHRVVRGPGAAPNASEVTVDQVMEHVLDLLASGIPAPRQRSAMAGAEASLEAVG